MKYYSIQIQFSYEDFSEEEKDIKCKYAKNEINKLASEFNGEFFSFDEDISFNDNDNKSIKLALNFSSIFFDLENLKKFIFKLPNYFKILWIHNNTKNDDNLTYVIYSTFNIPETKNFTLDDKELYRIILNRLKLKIN